MFCADQGSRRPRSRCEFTGIQDPGHDIIQRGERLDSLLNSPRSRSRAVSAVDGQTPLHQIACAPVALVFMDRQMPVRQMPVLDGLDATRKIRAMDGSIGNTPVVGLTASALNDELAACIAVGMHAVLAKPVTVRALRQAVLRWGRRARG